MAAPYPNTSRNDNYDQEHHLDIPTITKQFEIDFAKIIQKLAGPLSATDKAKTQQELQKLKDTHKTIIADIQRNLTNPAPYTPLISRRPGSSTDQAETEPTYPRFAPEPRQSLRQNSSYQNTVFTTQELESVKDGFGELSAPIYKDIKQIKTDIVQIKTDIAQIQKTLAVDALRNITKLSNIPISVPDTYQYYSLDEYSSAADTFISKYGSNIRVLTDYLEASKSDPKCKVFTTLSNDILYFHKELETDGELSNWYDSGINIKYKQRTYILPTAEHLIMAIKALHLGHVTIDKTIVEILQAPTARKAKDLCEKYNTNFTPELWGTAIKRKLYLPIIYEKFKQNKRLQNHLLATGDKILVEAAPNDKNWGIGYDATKAPHNKTKWGENLLGILLMDVRAILRKAPK